MERSWQVIRFSPKGYQEDVNDPLSEHGELDAADVEVEVQDGEVMLSGICVGGFGSK